jgi:hypothetical protein
MAWGRRLEGAKEVKEEVKRIGEVEDGAEAKIDPMINS